MAANDWSKYREHLHPSSISNFCFLSHIYRFICVMTHCCLLLFCVFLGAFINFLTVYVPIFF
jgi:hypothetical protein